MQVCLRGLFDLARNIVRECLRTKFWDYDLHLRESQQEEDGVQLHNKEYRSF